MIVSPRTLSPGAPATLLEPEPQAAHVRLTSNEPLLRAAASKHADATAHDRLDAEALRSVAALSTQMGDDLHTLSIGRWTQPEQRRELAREHASRFAATLSAMPGVWAVPTDAMKGVLNVRSGAATLQAALARPDLDLSLTRDGSGISRIANGFRTMTAGLWGTHLEGRDARIVGLARAANDAVLRIRDGRESSASGLPFRAGIQGGVTAALLGAVAAEGADLLPTTIAHEIRAALTSTAPSIDARGHGFPAGRDAYVAATRVLEAAAAHAQVALDGLAAPALRDPGERGAALRAWREVQRVHPGVPYYDADIGS
ncbi:MAG: hypothetical protein JWM86_1592 [Thermoleophilia bacterium]|nr:hypothetical protein [Thermoleophilia bacterium]